MEVITIQKSLEKDQFYFDIIYQRLLKKKGLPLVFTLFNFMIKTTFG